MCKIKKGIAVFRLISVCFLLLLSACSSMPTGYTGKDVGYLVVGMGKSESAPYQAIGIFYEEASKPGILHEIRSPPEFMWSKYGGPSPDYSDAFESGAVYIHQMKPGRYHLYQVWVTSNGGVHWYGKTSFKYNFTIEAGKTIYLGNFRAKVNPNEDLTRKYKYEPIFIVSDRRKTEMEIAKKKKPAIDLNNVIYQVPTIGNLPEYFVIE